MDQVALLRTNAWFELSETCKRDYGKLMRKVGVSPEFCKKKERRAEESRPCKTTSGSTESVERALV